MATRERNCMQWVMVLALVFLGIAPGQRTGEAVLKRVEGEMARVQDYVVTLDAVVNVERLNVPPMHVQMFYKHPDKFHFASNGFALLPREGLSFNVARVLSQFSVVDVAESTAHVFLTLRPKRETARSGRLELTIDTVLWRPVVVKSYLVDGRTMTVRFQYDRFDGYIMPSQLVVEFAASGEDTSDQPITMPGALPRVQMPRTGTIDIRYSDYKINIGLSDEIFLPREE